MPYEHDLTDDEKRELLRIARATLREHARSGRIPPGKPHRASLVAQAGVFVSLHLGGHLRGCIGHVEEDTPLYKVIQQMAVAAATRDPRFEPIQPDEVEELSVEISVLGGAEPASGPDDVTVGTHGLIVELGDKRGLLLPQVAVEHGWDAMAFLAHVCTKAGLEEDAWRSDYAELSRFSAQVFSDVTHPAKK